MDSIDVVDSRRKGRVGQNVWCVNFGRRRARLLFQSPAQAVEASGFADGRDAMREPKLVHIARAWLWPVSGVERCADMRMAVDEPRRQKFAGAIDFDVERIRCRIESPRDRMLARLAEAGDAPLLSRQIGRSPRRRAGSIKDRGLPEQDAFEWPLPGIAACGCLGARKLRGGEHGRELVTDQYVFAVSSHICATSADDQIRGAILHCLFAAGLLIGHAEDAFWAQLENED